jgi:hypothetical protein
VPSPQIDAAVLRALLPEPVGYVGRFRFRPMGQDERQSLMQRIEQEGPPIARTAPTFKVCISSA